MSKPKDGGPAFPHPSIWAEEGMSVRTWLAGQAMKGILSNQELYSVLVADVAASQIEDPIIDMAVDHADRMIAKLEE